MPSRTSPRRHRRRACTPRRPPSQRPQLFGVYECHQASAKRAARARRERQRAERFSKASGRLGHDKPGGRTRPRPRRPPRASATRRRQNGSRFWKPLRYRFGNYYFGKYIWKRRAVYAVRCLVRIERCAPSKSEIHINSHSCPHPPSLAAPTQHTARCRLERSHVDDMPLPWRPVSIALRSKRRSKLQARQQHLRMAARHPCADTPRELRFRQGSSRRWAEPQPRVQLAASCRRNVPDQPVEAVYYIMRHPTDSSTTVPPTNSNSVPITLL